MEIRSLCIPDEAPEDVVQFIKHLQENLDPENEHKCMVSISGITEEEAILPGDSETVTRSRFEEPERADMGVHIEIEFDGHKNHPSTVLDLAEGFYGTQEYVLHEEYDGKEGEYEAFVFESL